MHSNLCYANMATPTPGEEWLRMSDEERLEIIKNKTALKLSATNNFLKVVAVKMDGQVIIEFREPIDSNKRGTVLLDLEEYLKEAIDPSITVWLEPLGDQSILRNLRGIEVKS